MSPRAYTLGKRTASVEGTRRRVLEAAIATYREVGFRNASVQAIARRADVAAGTVAYHFPDADALVESALAQVLAELELPKPEDFKGKRSERVVALVRAMYAFYAKSADWYPWYERERDAVPALAKMEKRYQRQVGALVGAVVGPLARDERTMAAISLVLSPGTLGSLQRAGLTPEQSADLACELLLPWLDRRSR